jgi:hypothetical protein
MLSCASSPPELEIISSFPAHKRVTRARRLSRQTDAEPAMKRAEAEKVPQQSHIVAVTVPA